MLPLIHAGLSGLVRAVDTALHHEKPVEGGDDGERGEGDGDHLADFADEPGPECGHVVPSRWIGSSSLPVAV